MDPAFWGRSTWTYLHTLSFNYPEKPTENDRLKYYNYFQQLPDFLPCPSCADSFRIYLKYIPIDNYLNDIYGITFWLYIIHFIVNSKLKKLNMDFYNVIKLYLPNRTLCTSPLNQSENVQSKDITKSANLSGKCTKPSTSLPKNKFTEFQDKSNQYLEQTNIYISNLKRDHPSLI